MPFEADITIVAQALDRFYNDSISARKPVIDQKRLDQVVRDLDLEYYAKKGGLEGKKLQLFLDKYLAYNTRLHHPAYLGHQCAAPHYAAALGTFVNAFTNNVSSIYEMGPASVGMEYFLINWMLEKVGWKKAPTTLARRVKDQDFGGGVLVDGGSLANLTALIIARSALVPDVWEKGTPSNLSILLPSKGHYSLAKAAGVMGIGAEAIRFVDVDEMGAIRPDRLQRCYKRTLQEGKRPIALVANACSTAVGIYDPLDEIADFCQENALWMHVDGAHGASALLSNTYGRLLKGVEKADSLVWDAHKLLQTPSLCAALLLRDHKHLDQGLQISLDASYLFHQKQQPGFDFIHRTLETTKSGLGEKLFFVLGALGERGLGKYIDRQYGLALQAYDYINELADFECPVRPQSNILCFKIKGDSKTQMDIRQRLTDEGRYYITTVLFNGERYLRLVFMSERTTLAHIKDLIGEIRKIRLSLLKDAKEQLL
ncbi:pyridoxal-dependent decarboxylase [Flavobacteriaceae bacterium 3-367]